MKTRRHAQRLASAAGQPPDDPGEGRGVSLGCGLLQNRDDASSLIETHDAAVIFSKRDPGVPSLSLTGRAPQLQRKLVNHRKAGRADWMASHLSVSNLPNQVVALRDSYESVFKELIAELSLPSGIDRRIFRLAYWER